MAVSVVCTKLLTFVATTFRVSLAIPRPALRKLAYMSDTLVVTSALIRPSTVS